MEGLSFPIGIMRPLHRDRPARAFPLQVSRTPVLIRLRPTNLPPGQRTPSQALAAGPILGDFRPRARAWRGAVLTSDKRREGGEVGGMPGL